jgi:hypothetical protein
MEKIIYALSRSRSDAPESFSKRLVTDLGRRLINQHALKVSVAIDDADVASAASLRIVHRRLPIEAVVSLWVHSANDRAQIESLLRGYADTFCGYLVTESEPLAGPETAGGGQRSPGMMQIAFLQRPSGLGKDEWFSIWRDEHTRVAIETQSTFVYRQNLVVRALTPDAPPVAAIVEEAFPEEAMTSQHAFYDAVGDDEKLDRNRKRLWESSKRFVDIATIEVMPASEYVW